jgi:hypothetical protein
MRRTRREEEGGLWGWMSCGCSGWAEVDPEVDPEVAADG